MQGRTQVRPSFFLMEHGSDGFDARQKDGGQGFTRISK
jgi:hypothetical protein